MTQFLLAWLVGQVVGTGIGVGIAVLLIRLVGDPNPVHRADNARLYKEGEQVMRKLYER